MRSYIVSHLCYALVSIALLFQKPLMLSSASVPICNFAREPQSRILTVYRQAYLGRSVHTDPSMASGIH